MLPFFDMPVDWKRFILILAGGASLGFAWNAFSGRGIVLGQSVLTQAGDELVKAPDAKALLDKGALFLDARPRDFWRMSRIPGSLSLPEEDFDKAFAGGRGPRCAARARSSSTAAATAATRATSWRASCARRASPRAILDEGLPAWEDARLPLDTEKRP